MNTDADLGLQSAGALAELIRTRQLASRELLDHYQWRLEQLNSDLNAVVTTDFERARIAADRADAAVVGGDPIGPLHGLPITVKDAIATEGIRSTGGAEELSDHVPTEDAPVVAAVKDAGAVVFGKTNLPRWSGDTQAFNSIFGTTNNPWDLARGPGGSSGGASAAVSSGLTSFEIGTDIGGSVRLPAHFAGVCGHKPSFGVIPQLGYLSHPSAGLTEADVNVFGPLARSVADLQLLFDVMARPTADRSVGWRLDLPEARHRHLDDFRVAAWFDDPVCPVAADVRSLLENAASQAESGGAIVDRQARPGVPLSAAWDTGLPLISAATTPARTEAEFEKQKKAADQAVSDTTLQDRSALMRTSASAIRHRDWLLLTEQRERDRRAWAEFFTEHDILLCPVSARAAFPHSQEGGLYERRIDIDGTDRPYVDLIVWTSFIGYVYLPSTVVPVGLTPEGLPVGVQVVAPYLEDHTALRFARLLEGRLQEAGAGGYQVPPMARLETA